MDNKIGFWELLTLVFIGLKLSNHLQDWNWIMVFSPIILKAILTEIYEDYKAYDWKKRCKEMEEKKKQHLESEEKRIQRLKQRLQEKREQEKREQENE